MLHQHHNIKYIIFILYNYLFNLVANLCLCNILHYYCIDLFCNIYLHLNKYCICIVYNKLLIMYQYHIIHFFSYYNHQIYLFLILEIVNS